MRKQCKGHLQNNNKMSIRHTLNSIVVGNFFFLDICCNFNNTGGVSGTRRMALGNIFILNIRTFAFNLFSVLFYEMYIS